MSSHSRAPASTSWNARADRDEIRQVIATYFVGVDRCDWDLVRTCYHPDAFEDHGTFTGPAASFITWLSEGHENYAMTMLCGVDPRIALDGDTAHCQTYATVRHRMRPDDRGVVMTDASGGRLLDRMERRDGQWRIAHRQLLMEWKDDRRPVGTSDPGR